MNIFTPLLLGLIGLCVSWLVLGVLCRQSAAASWGDAGRQLHHTHSTPIPRLGGLAFVLAFIVIAWVALMVYPESLRREVHVMVVMIAPLMFGLGFWDDLRPLGARRKLIGQILIASLAWCAGIQIAIFQNPLTGQDVALGWLGLPVTVFWLVALTNLINLIDGIDGLAVGIGLMLMGLLAYVGFQSYDLSFFLAVGMAGALVAFLCYNFPPAKIYMGDGGAYFIGFLVGCLSIVNSQKGTIAAGLIAPVFALALPILDVTMAIVRRGLRGLPLFRPDKHHIHHRLIRGGLSRRQAVLILYGVSSIGLILAFVVFWAQGRVVALLFGFLCLTLLLAARAFNFSREWFSVGQVLNDSLELRKVSGYALALGRWLELEAERSPSLQHLWQDYQFVLRKLGFSRVKLKVESAEHCWEAEAALETESERHSARHEAPGKGGGVLEFEAPEQMPAKAFELVSELAAEMWVNASACWHRRQLNPARLESAGKFSRTPVKQSRSEEIEVVPEAQTQSSD